MEKEILLLIQELRSPLLDKFFVFITSLGNGGWIFILTALILLINKKHKKLALRIGLSLIFCLVLGNLILKPLIGRPRPFTKYGVDLIIRAPKDYSFPSGHTYSAFAFYYCISKYNKRYGIYALILAILIAFSRMYLFVHYPSDILFGIIIGILCGKLSIYTLDFLERRSSLKNLESK